MTAARIQRFPVEPKSEGRLYRALRAINPLRATVRFVRGHFYRYRPQVWHLEGLERVSGLPLVIVYAGQLENKNYISHLAFVDSPAERALGRRWLWTLVPPGKNRQEDGCDLRVVELYENQRRWLGTRFRFLVPIWMGSQLDLERVSARLRRSKNARYEVRRLLRDGFTYDVAHNREAFEYFYSNMYLSYIKNRYGDRAFSMSHEDMVAKLHCAELFFVNLRGERVAGHILLYENNGVRAWSMGIKDGNISYVKTGAIKALDHFTHEYLTERGYTVLHLGASRPFLRDGVLRHKKRLGVRVSDHTTRYFSLHWPAGSAGARTFFVSNPFIYLSDGRYRGALFIESDMSLAPERLAELHEEYHIDGMSGLSLFDASTGGAKLLAQIPERSVDGAAA